VAGRITLPATIIIMEKTKMVRILDDFDTDISQVILNDEYFVEAFLSATRDITIDEFTSFNPSSSLLVPVACLPKAGISLS